MARTNVEEKTKGTYLVTFLDDSSRPTQPNTARWCLYNETTGEDIVAWTDVSVPSTGFVEVIIPASYTACTTTGDELLVIGLEAEYGTEDQVSSEHELLVKNLRKT